MNEKNSMKIEKKTTKHDQQNLEVYACDIDKDELGIDVASYIQTVRDKRVIVDSDLAKLYGVTTKRLNEQVKRNIERFPEDFMFGLTCDEKIKLVADCAHLSKIKYSSTLPNAFTEHGVVMAASVLNTKRAIQVSLYVVRAFVSMRNSIRNGTFERECFFRLKEQIDLHDKAIVSIIRVVRGLMEPGEEKQSHRRIGFTP